MLESTHKLAALILVVFYGIVGCTGESLHYLAQDFDLQAFLSGASRAEGYFHSHAPDHFVHFHHQHWHPADSSLPPKKKSTKPEYPDALKEYTSFHDDHACPLLRIVSELRLGHGHFTPVRMDIGRSQNSLSYAMVSPPYKPADTFYSRGPPSMPVA